MGGKQRSDWWLWFSQNEATLVKNQDLSDLYQQMAHRLQRIDSEIVSDLVFNDKPPHRLIISANGNQQAFPEIIRLVDEAPSLRFWRVRAFRPRVAGHFTLRSEEVSLSTPNVFFDYTQGKSAIKLQIYLIDGEVENKQLHMLARLMLDRCLGEYDAAVRIMSFELLTLVLDESKPNLNPIITLPDVIDRIFGKIKN